MAIQMHYRTGVGNLWVARNEGLVIGLKDIGNCEAAQRKMLVAAPWRGPEYAVVRQLLECLLDAAKHRGLQQVYLGTMANFLAVHRFYQKYGFKLVEKNALPELSFAFREPDCVESGPHTTCFSRSGPQSSFDAFLLDRTAATRLRPSPE